MDNVRIVMLKNNQHIITILRELIDDSGASICFEFVAPLIVSYAALNEEENNVQISFTAWSPFSKSVKFRVPFDHVITVGEVKDDILSNYIELIKPIVDNYLNKEDNELEVIQKELELESETGE